ncbi:MAG: hypothetical protein AAFQ92_29645, partial [Bacteroidota bacterium]
MKEEDLWRVESSAYEWIGLEEDERRSFMKRRKRVGDKTEPCGTPLVTVKDEDVAPSTTTDKVRSDRKLAISLVREGVKPKDGSLANRALCQTLSNALEISSFLSDRSISVVVDGTTSSTYSIASG